MTAGNEQVVLRASAVFTFVAGLFLLTGTWDGLWDALDLPQGRPALFVQVGGAVTAGFAYLLWQAAEQPPLRGAVALAAAGADALVAVIVLVWIVTGSLPDDIDGLGTAILIALVVVLGAFALLEAKIATRAAGREEHQR